MLTHTIVKKNWDSSLCSKNNTSSSLHGVNLLYSDDINYSFTVLLKIPIHTTWRDCVVFWRHKTISVFSIQCSVLTADEDGTRLAALVANHGATLPLHSPLLAPARLLVEGSRHRLSDATRRTAARRTKGYRKGIWWTERPFDARLPGKALLGWSDRPRLKRLSIIVPPGNPRTAMIARGGGWLPGWWRGLVTTASLLASERQQQQQQQLRLDAVYAVRLLAFKAVATRARLHDAVVEILIFYYYFIIINIIIRWHVHQQCHNNVRRVSYHR